MPFFSGDAGKLVELITIWLQSLFTYLLLCEVEGVSKHFDVSGCNGQSH